MRKWAFGCVLKMENVIQDNIVDDDTRDDTNYYEDTRLWEYLGYEMEMMEDDF